MSVCCVGTFYLHFASVREQQANELLQKNVKEADDARESSTVSLSQHEDLKKQKLALEKDYLSLKEELSEVDNAVISKIPYEEH